MTLAKWWGSSGWWTPGWWQEAPSGVSGSIEEPMVFGEGLFGGYGVGITEPIVFTGGLLSGYGNSITDSLVLNEGLFSGYGLNITDSVDFGDALFSGYGLKIADPLTLGENTLSGYGVKASDAMSFGESFLSGYGVIIVDPMLPGDALWDTVVAGTARVKPGFPFPRTKNGTAITTLGIVTIYNSVGITLKKYMPEMYGKTQDFGWAEWADRIFLTPLQTAGRTLVPLVWMERGCTTSGNIELPEEYHYLIPLYVYSKVLTKYRFYEEAALIREQYESEMDRIKWRK